jgi:putative membrane protein
MLAAAGTAVTSSIANAADGKVGKVAPTEFKKINAEAGAKLAAIKPTSDPLSNADGALLIEMALGGMMQLEMSRAALAKATSGDVRAIAHAEVEEQTGLAAKLKEIATAKSAQIPDAPDEKTKKAVEKLDAKTGAAFDKDYLQESGVDGHQMLQKTMEKVQSKAADATLKLVASTALPLIQKHLEVSKDELKDV